ncbi:MAG: M48 family metallopeptidase [Verrucomicrobiales bacterium]|jgi:Zn-dependent protease with chaperone function|nr:M48 family metallopeptidase [Verrucomicrobiales bacterium]
MDFFERQAQARKSTRWLVVYFALAVALTIGALYLAAVAGLAEFGSAPVRWWDASLAIGVTLTVGAIVALGSTVRTFQLIGGGGVIATELGGTPLNPLTPDLDEQKLYHIVEEMSIAAGVPMPKIYVLQNEPGINAFAAGQRSSDTAIGVTRGAIEQLTRDELQGVIGHEFSHILNGDMKLNMRLACLTFGILFISLTGQLLLRSLAYARVNNTGKKNNGGLLLLILAAGLALLVIGAIGYFFTRVIQAAVCRQREFLADASAVQFTRNPAGIAGALKKIARLPRHGALTTPQAAKAGHFLFSSGSAGWWEHLFSTHPPLAERIAAIDSALQN